MTDVLRVLIVEDEDDAAEILDALLRHYHLTADHVATAEDAFHALTSEHYDAVIADLFLPGMDGLELMRHIRQSPALSNLPGIAVTAYNSSGMKKDALNAGFNLYYAKPLNADDLAQGLRSLLR